MENKLVRPFIWSAGAILLAAALMRFVIAARDAQVLLLPEPVLGISLRHSLWLVGGIELAVALMCLFGKKLGLPAMLLAWLMTNFVVYQIAAFTMNCHFQGICTGGLTDPFHLSRGISGLFMQLIPVYLLLGSYGALAWLWIENRTVLLQRLAAGVFKMFCPACGGKIKFSIENMGQTAPCPHCRKETILRKPDLLKMACFFCKEHIQFPTHAIGEKMPCPHCKMNITLKEPM